MIISNCTVCSSKKSRFIKEQKTKGFLGSALAKILILGPLLI